MKTDPLKLLFWLLMLFGLYLLVNRMLGHSATLELIVTILTGGFLAAILDLYKTNGDVRERLARIEKDIELIKSKVVK
jgi:hypothetical protein